MPRFPRPAAPVATSVGRVITAGVDLATEPERTALAVLDWNESGARVTVLSVGVDDDQVVRTAEQVTTLGIDCPLGWPDTFVEFLQGHHTGHVLAPRDVRGTDWRRTLAYRETDRAVRAVTGLTPLSVAADRIGLTAMRAAGLLARLAALGDVVDRAGSGVVVEVYPAASLRMWGLAHRGYKGNANLSSRVALLESLLSGAPWLDMGPYADLCASSDDALDAVVAALTARAAALSVVTRPVTEQEKDRAGREGWIVLPTGPLSSLVPGATDLPRPRGADPAPAGTAPRRDVEKHPPASTTQ